MVSFSYEERHRCKLQVNPNLVEKCLIQLEEDFQCALLEYVSAGRQNCELNAK